MQAANSGLFINTMGWVTDLGLELLYHAIRVLQVDIVLVLGDDKLYNTLHQHCRWGFVCLHIVMLRCSSISGAMLVAVRAAQMKFDFCAKWHSEAAM